MKLIPKNWSQFQHYGKRRPPWIKLYRSLLDDYDFYCLPVASKALAPMLWLLASERPDGAIEMDATRLAFRVRMTEKELVSALKPLIQNGFFEDASNTLAPSKQLATSERETETEGETEAEEIAPKRAKQLPDNFQPTDAHRQLATELGVQLTIELPKFTDYHRAKGSTMKDWDAALRTWLRNAAQFARKGKPVNPILDPKNYRDYNLEPREDGSF